MSPREKRLFYILIFLLLYKVFAYELYEYPTVHHFDNTSKLCRLNNGDIRRLCIDKYNGQSCDTIEDVGIKHSLAIDGAFLGGEGILGYVMEVSERCPVCKDQKAWGLIPIAVERRKVDWRCRGCGYTVSEWRKQTVIESGADYERWKNYDRQK